MTFEDLKNHTKRFIEQHTTSARPQIVVDPVVVLADLVAMLCERLEAQYMFFRGLEKRLAQLELRVGRTEQRLDMAEEKRDEGRDWQSGWEEK